MERALEGLPGVGQVSVSLEQEAAALEYDPSRVTPKEIVQAVQRAVMLPGLRRSLERAARWRRRGEV